MGFRCELCDDWLPMLSFCKLCSTCYKLRTIVKCYSANDVLKNVESSFLVSHCREEEEKVKDKKFFIEEEVRLQKEFEEDLKKLTKDKEEHLIKESNKPKENTIDKLETIVEESNAYKTRHGGKKKDKKSI